jgi:hypothetical protein
MAKTSVQRKKIGIYEERRIGVFLGSRLELLRVSAGFPVFIHRTGGGSGSTCLYAMYAVIRANLL